MLNTTHRTIFSVLVLWLLSACATTVKTQSTANLGPLAADSRVEVFALKDHLIGDIRTIGEVKIGDSGLTVDCGYETVIEQAKAEARKVGGNGIKLTKVDSPDFMSTCYRITADILRIEKKFISEESKKTVFDETSLKQTWSKNGLDPIEGIYEKVGDGQSAKYTLAIKKSNNSEYLAIYLNGALSDFSQKWSEGDKKAKL